MNAKKILDDQFDQMVEFLQRIIRFNTEKSAPIENAPFGANVRECLDFVLNYAKSFGLETYNCDGYAGHAELPGTSNEVLGILGHLDVVPANPDEWRYPPYSAEIHGGKLFGRGAMDDKGPMIACLFAVKALSEAKFVPTKTIRLIFGCDEESGMQCVEHYFSKMPYPTVSFSPDGDFPVINREKGIYQFDIVCGKLPDGVKITAGDRANVVPSLCTVAVPNKLQVDDTTGVEYSKTDGGYTYTSIGKAAHGSTPDEGINAAHRLLLALANTYPKNKTLQFMQKVADTSGVAWNVSLSDTESGKLTCNLGVLRTSDDGILTATVDIRFPVTYTCDSVYQLLRVNTPSEFELIPRHISEPLYVNSNSELVTTLMDVYNGMLKTNLQPIAIGGGTYSRCLPNCVAFGPLFPQEEQTIHMPNECITLENLRVMSQLYLEAIYRLAK